MIRTPNQKDNRPGGTVQTTFDQLNPNNDESFSINTEHSTNPDDSTPTTTEYFDFSGRIDIRSDFGTEINQMIKETTTIITDDTDLKTSTETNINNVAASSNKSSNIFIIPNEKTKKNLPSKNETQNLVRRRRQIFNALRHHLN